MAATPLERSDLDGPASVLAALETTQAELNRQEIAKFRLAAEWADAHPVDDLDDAATVDGTQGE
ncbi:MAG TPA: HNH endonuclease, partial [Marmoricola sp.]